MTAGAARADRKTMADRAPRPRDRFDDVPVDLARVGAHRAPVRRRGIVTFAWAALATGALVGAGVLGLGAIEGRVSGGATASTTTSSAAAAGPAATVDPDAEVVLLNATSTSGLAARASSAIAGDGWTVTSTANADLQNLKTSTVYYGRAAQLGAAKGLAESLGITRAPVRSDRFDVQGRARLTAVLGSDYAAG